MKACLPGTDLQGQGCPVWGLNHLHLKEELLACDIPPACGSPSRDGVGRGTGSQQTSSLLLLPFLMWCVLHMFRCGRAVLLVFRLFPESCSVCIWSFGVSVGDDLDLPYSTIYPLLPFMSVFGSCILVLYC